MIKLFNDVELLSDLPIIQPSSVSLVTEDGHLNVVKIESVLDLEYAGIGLLAYDDAFLTNIDSATAYELGFWAKGDGVLTASVQGYDEGNQLYNPTLAISNPSETSAIRSKKLIRSDSWIFVRIIVHPYNEALTSDPSVQIPNIGVGWNLKWRENTCKAGVQIFVDRTLALDNDPPTVTNNDISASNGELRTITLEDVTKDYTDIQGNPFESIDINSFTGPGNLLLNSVIINSFPTNVTKQQLVDGLLQFQDDGSDITSKTIIMEYDVNDEQSIGSDNDILYIRDVVLKPLRTSYGKGIIGSPLLVENWLRNRGGLSDDEVVDFTRKYLIPHHVAIQQNFILRQPTLGTGPGLTKGIYEDLYEDLYQ